MGCLLSKQAVATDTPDTPKKAQELPLPPSGRIRALLYNPLTFGRLSRWVYLKRTQNQSSGACGEVGGEHRPITAPLETLAYGIEVDITHQSAWLLEKATQFLNCLWLTPARNGGNSEGSRCLKRWTFKAFFLRVVRTLWVCG